MWYTCWGYNPLILTIDPKFLVHPSGGCHMKYQQNIQGYWVQMSNKKKRFSYMTSKWATGWGVKRLTDIPFHVGGILRFQMLVFGSVFVCTKRTCFFSRTKTLKNPTIIFFSSVLGTPTQYKASKHPGRQDDFSSQCQSLSSEALLDPVNFPRCRSGFGVEIPPPKVPWCQLVCPNLPIIGGM